MNTNINTNMNTLAWRYVGYCVEGQNFWVEGMNISNHIWQPVDDAVAGVEDPHNHKQYEFPVWEVKAEGRVVRFAAGEFQNCVWGFFRKH